MNLYHQLLTNVFILPDEYNDTDQAYKFSKQKNIDVSFTVFVESLLEKNELINEIGYVYKNDSTNEDIEEMLKIIDTIKNKIPKDCSSLDIFDNSNNEYRIYKVQDDNVAEIDGILKLSCLRFWWNGELERDLEGEITDEESNDPYDRYGVSKKDF